MKRRDFLLGAGLLTATTALASAGPRRLNFILVNFDDLGYGDLGCYGNKVHRTPHLDELASDGVRFTDFSAPSSVCTPSRVALLTGRYPLRAGLTALLWPEDKIGLPEGEITLAQALRAGGYATGLVGKWHLGHGPEYLPARRGFDSWFGLPYPNDMDGRHPRSISMKLNWPPLPLMRDGVVVAQPADVDLLTEQFTADAEKFIARHRARPFFLYLAHAMPHTWLGASAAFRRRSQNGVYGAAVEEVDSSIGRIRAALKRHGLAENTVLIVTNDNGASVPPDPGDPSAVASWRQLHSDDSHGSNAPLRGGKQDVLEGGVRVPCLAYLPGGVINRVDTAPASMLDILPTCLELAGVPLPGDRVIDGRSLAPVLRGTGTREETDLFYGSDQLLAVRSGRWKLVERRSIRERDRKAPPVDELYDLTSDPAESRNLAAAHAERVAALKERMALMQAEMMSEAVSRGYRADRNVTD